MISESKNMSSSEPSIFAAYPSLAGRSVFVTGGSSGIGGDIVIAFARQGARVGFTGRNAQAAAEVVQAAKQVGPEPLFLQSDATDVAALQGAIATTASHFGDISVLVNNVANDERHDLMAVTPDDFDWRVSINLRPHFFAAQAVVEGMKRLGGGAIINLGSTSWKIKGKGYPVYATCKSATIGLSRSLARELGEHNIRVNTLTPGWIMTDKQLALWVDAAGEQAMNDNQCLPGRIVGDDVANMALFLAADDSRMVTAQDFVIDAGWT
jgi:NAD(P)-dependent dehydrogenase (short-subunit alcohol dehydrogenase family)